jgi:hypothetical protein
VRGQALLGAANGFLELRQALAGLVGVQAHVQLEALAVIVDLRLDLREAAGPTGRAHVLDSGCGMSAFRAPSKFASRAGRGDETQGECRRSV